MTKDAFFNPKLIAALWGQEKEPGYDEWLQAEVERGLAQARAGIGRTNEDVEAEFAARRVTVLIG